MRVAIVVRWNFQPLPELTRLSGNWFSALLLLVLDTRISGASRPQLDRRGYNRRVLAWKAGVV